MTYNVELSEKAEIHLENIYNWLLLNHPASARKVKNKLIDSIKSLSTFPNRGARYRRTDYKFLVSGKFKIVYKVETERVIIIAID